MRKNIERLIKSGITAHRVALETEIPRNTAYRIFRGEAKIDNITLKNAEILNEYYIKNKELFKMEKVFKELQKNFKIDGENERYATMYNSKDEIVDEMDKEIFEETFDVDASSLSYPVITFDDSNAIDGHIFESGQEDEILDFAENYLERK